ncbi:MAG: hypothetical protein IPG52_15695 [Rhodocyclaceae bacterium]|nr:hypothetical protein [Rhodocyclaceae bacterium]
MTDLADAVAHAVPLMAGKIVPATVVETHRIDGHELRLDAQHRYRCLSVRRRSMPAP